MLTGAGLFLALFLFFSDTVSNAKYKARTRACRQNLVLVGQAVAAFRAAHGGQMPPTLAALLPFLPNQYGPPCPQSGGGYGYRYLRTPGPGDVICWDPAPHTPGYSVAFFLNTPNRRVLTAGGGVRVLSEAQFQALRLPGVPP